MRQLLVLLLSVLAIGILFSCSESRFVEPEEPTFLVSGTIYSITCSWIDIVKPYSEISSHPATVIFESLDDGAIYEASTNSESRYSLNLLEGDYLVKNYSYHWRPQGRDTISVPGDSIIDQTGLVIWYTSDTVSVGFYYPLGDTLTQSEELDLIRSINAETGGYLGVEHARRHTFDPVDTLWLAIQNTYYMPIAPELPPWITVDSLTSTMNADTIAYPPVMFASLDYMICFGTQGSDTGRGQ